jgi:hypothetical protein
MEPISLPPNYLEELLKKQRGVFEPFDTNLGPAEPRTFRGASGAELPAGYPEPLTEKERRKSQWFKENRQDLADIGEEIATLATPITTPVKWLAAPLSKEFWQGETPGAATTSMTPETSMAPLTSEEELRKTLPGIPESVLKAAVSQQTAAPSQDGEKRTPRDWARLFREQEMNRTNGTNGTNAAIPRTAAASTGTPSTGKKPFDWDIVSGFPATEQEMTAGGQGYIRDANGAMALSSEVDKQGHRIAYEPDPYAMGQSRKIPAEQMGFAGEIRGPVEQRDFSIVPTHEVSPEALAASEELRGRADEAHQARNVIGQARQMALADFVRQEKDHAAFRQEHGIFAPDLDTPGEASDLLTPAGRPKKQKDYLEWAKRQDEEFVNQRRQLQEQMAQLDQHYGMAGRTRERFLQESQSVLEQDKAGRQAAYEKQLAYTTAVKHKEAEELRANAAQADEETRKESEKAAKEADKEAKDAEKERAQLERRRVADQRRDLNEQEDATKQLKGIYEGRLKDFEKALEERGTSATGRGMGSAWTPALGAPDPANAMYKGKKAQFDQDMADFERHKALKKRAEDIGGEYERLVEARRFSLMPEGGGATPPQNAATVWNRASRRALKVWVENYTSKYKRKPNVEDISAMKDHIRKAAVAYGAQ